MSRAVVAALPTPEALLRALPFGVALFDRERRLLMVNDACLDALGLPRASGTVGQSLEAFLKAAAPAGTLGPGTGPDGTALPPPGDEGRRLRRRFDRPDGRRFEMRAGPMEGNGFLLCAIETTGLAEAEEEAIRRAEMLDGILENIPHGVCVYGPSRRVTMFNRPYVEIMDGAPLAVGDHLEEVIRRRADAGEYGPGDPATIYTEQLAHDISRPQVRRRQRPNGRTMDVRTAPLPDGGHISVVTDVTSLTRAEDALIRRAGQMDVMLANIRHGVMLFDAGRRLLAANPRAAELLNLPPGFLVPGRTETEILQAMHTAGEFGAGETAASLMPEEPDRDRSAPRVRLRRTAAGRILEIRADPAPGDTLVVTYTDVTEAELARAEQRRAKAAAEGANQAKSRFLATMSHELRTPLNAVIGFSEALLREGDNTGPARVAEFATAISEAGRHLLRLINTILDVARIEAGRFEMSADPVNVRHLLRTCQRQAEPSFLAGEVILRLDLPDLLPVVRADERRLQQAIANLLSNAAKFTPAGGEVVLRAAVRPPGDLAIEVADSGIGIPEADLERIFEPFVQLDADLTRRFQGAGLGLYMSRALVEAHGGALRLRSTVGAGTVAEIVLPAWRLTGESPNANEDAA